MVWSGLFCMIHYNIVMYFSECPDNEELAHVPSDNSCA